jgi:thioredoxin reductase
VAIVGAGPYGLSLAAQLRARGIPLRIFGPPMDNWRHHMPAGMQLKSDGFASNLYDADARFTLKRFCEERGIAYDDLTIPVRLDTFVAYALAFQAQMVPNLEQRLVTGLKRADGAFVLQLDNGETVQARRVVVASGISHCANVPAMLARLGPQLCTHSSEHPDPSALKGKRVVVVGGGASALDLAALLHAAGAQVTVVARHPVHFSKPPGPGRPSLWQRIRRPHLGLGPSMRSALYTRFPHAFRLLPLSLRLRIVRRHLGPGAGWFVRPLLQGIVPIHEEYSLSEARAVDGGVALRFENVEGRPLELNADHVVAATGYKPSVARLPFLDESLRAEIALYGESAALSPYFESSVPGLYFVGLMAANSFGPLLRFALGAGFTSRRLAIHLARLVRGAGRLAVPIGQRQAD